MARIALILVAVAALLIVGCGPEPTREVTADTFAVIRIIDGDTFVIHYDGEPTSVRLYGFDAPERNEPGGLAATERLRDMIEGRTVRLVLPGRRKHDCFGRLLAQVYVDDVEVNSVLASEE